MRRFSEYCLLLICFAFVGNCLAAAPAEARAQQTAGRFTGPGAFRRFCHESPVGSDRGNELIAQSVGWRCVTFAIGPLAVEGLAGVALVFGATRHENTDLIMKHAFLTGRWITVFMGIIFSVLCVLEWLA